MNENNSRTVASLGVGHAGKARRKGFNPVAVAPPDMEFGWMTDIQSRDRIRIILMQYGLTELLLRAWRHPAAQLVDQGLHPIADA